MSSQRITKFLFILLPCIAIFYLTLRLNVVLQSKDDFLISLSRNCVCQSVNNDLQVAFSIGSVSNNFSCPMTVINQGRLGNVMGEYATLLALAQMNGHAPYQQQSMKTELNKYFNTSMPVVNDKVNEQANWTRHYIHDWMSDEYSEFGCDFTFIVGSPCSWTFFHHIRDDVKREFQFQHDIVSDAQAHLRSLRNSSTTTYIGVHTRRGDYVNLMNNTYNGVLASPEFFTQSMNYFRSKFKECVFVVCSDDLDWCKRNIDNSSSDVHFCWNGESSTSGRDMALLTQCNHSIITIGTFGFWSAYLTGGQVVYLNNYLRNTSIFLNVFHFKAAYLPEWIPIDADLNSTKWLS